MPWSARTGSPLSRNQRADDGTEYALQDALGDGRGVGGGMLVGVGVAIAVGTNTTGTSRVSLYFWSPMRTWRSPHRLPQFGGGQSGSE